MPNNKYLRNLTVNFFYFKTTKMIIIFIIRHYINCNDIIILKHFSVISFGHVSNIIHLFGHHIQLYYQI